MVKYEPRIIETETPPQITEISVADGLFINPRFSQDRRLRKSVYSKILAAKALLPTHLTFMIYEAYRPHARQVQMWEDIQRKIRSENPDMSNEDILDLCDNYVANPYHIGSGHQFGCAIDITLCTYDGIELDMGTAVQEFSDACKTLAPNITEHQAYNRRLLQTALSASGLVNYPAEWCHCSYGDRLWALLPNKPETLYGPLRDPVMVST